jgi:hypothetical protein
MSERSELSGRPSGECGPLSGGPRRIEATVTALSWIPSEAIRGVSRVPFALGTFHYDEPPPDSLADLGPDPVEALRVADRFRVANVLHAWIEVDDHGTIVAAGHLGGGRIGATTLRLGTGAWSVLASPLPDIQPAPVVADGVARFTQTAGGRTGVPFPRIVRRPPFVQYHAPIAWSTLSLAIHADGRTEAALVGASPFPRHWVYGPDGRLVAKSALTANRSWAAAAFGRRTPWGEHDSPALVAAAESALERELSTRIIRGGAKPRVRRLGVGDVVIEQGDVSDELFVLLDGLLEVVVDGDVIAELGPGAVVGERANLEGGRRTSTLRARTRAAVVCTRPDELEPGVLADLATGHRREG